MVLAIKLTTSSSNSQSSLRSNCLIRSTLALDNQFTYMVTKKLLKEYFLLLAAIAWSVVSYCYHLSGDPSMWFARSGAVLIFSAVVVEYRLSGMLQKRTSSANATAGLGIPTGVGVPKANKILAIVSHVLVLLGTIIWAYGDVFHV